MARRFLAITPWPGVFASGLVAFLTFGTLIAVAMRAEGTEGLSRFDWLAIRFTIVQAVLSALISVGLAIPIARALARRKFVGKQLLVTLLGAPFILPVIVAILGLTAVFGRNGIVSNLLDLAGLESISIYGFHGVILAHVFFNLPLATRLLLHGWSTVPAESFRLGASLGFSTAASFRHIEFPMLRQVVPGTLAVIFLICTTSFAVALTFGGGPKATTVELAIYEAFRYDVDLGRASVLSLIQFAICGAAVLLSLRFTMPPMTSGRLDRGVQRFDVQSWHLRLVDLAWITIGVGFLLAPLCALLVRGAPNLVDLPSSVLLAAVRSLIMALAATFVSIGLSLSIAVTALRWNRVEIVGLLSIAASPLVMGTGLFLMLFPWVDTRSVALPLTVIVNAVMALPFALRALIPAVRSAEADFGKLADGLGMTGWTRLRLLILPRIRGPLGFSAGLTAALSMGDLGVVTLFAPPNGATLPLQIYRLMGAYRMEQAMGAAVLLLSLAFLLFYIFDWIGRRDA